MILLTRFNGPVFALNPDLIERADHTPDTVITLVDGTKYVIAESLDELILIMRRHRAGVLAEAELLISRHASDVVRPLGETPGPDNLHRLDGGLDGAAVADVPQHEDVQEWAGRAAVETVQPSEHEPVRGAPSDVIPFHRRGQ